MNGSECRTCKHWGSEDSQVVNTPFRVCKLTTYLYHPEEAGGCLFPPNSFRLVGAWETNRAEFVTGPEFGCARYEAVDGGCSSVGRAPDCGSGCRGFDSPQSPLEV